MKQFIAVRKNDKKNTPLMIALSEIARIGVYENPEHEFPVEVAHAVIVLKDSTKIVINETYTSLLARMDNCMVVII